MMLEQVLDLCESLTALAGAMFGDAGETTEEAERAALLPAGKDGEAMSDAA